MVQTTPHPPPPARHPGLWIALLAGTLLALGANRAAAAPAPPTLEVVRYYTEPLIKARLRLPDSLQDLVVTQITATAEDPARFLVRLQFKAGTPFGSATQHGAGFLMKRAASGQFWVVTAE